VLFLLKALGCQTSPSGEPCLVGLQNLPKPYDALDSDPDVQAFHPTPLDRCMTLSKETKQIQLYGIFGYPIQHSLSPQMHQAAFEALGLRNIYLPFEVPPDQLKRAVEAILPLGLQGVNITIPHKETVMPFLDRIDGEAEKIGAVNTVEVRAGQLIGHNTDGKGFMTSLIEEGVDPKSLSVLLIGAGGAAKGVAVALLSAGVSKMAIQVRQMSKGKKLAKQLGTLSPHAEISVIGTDLKKKPPMPDDGPVLLVNATPLGMATGDPLPFPIQWIKADWIVADLIYRPYETPFLLASKSKGAKTIPGMGMLLHQGALSFDIWTHSKPPIAAMRWALMKALLPGTAAVSAPPQIV